MRCSKLRARMNRSGNATGAPNEAPLLLDLQYQVRVEPPFVHMTMTMDEPKKDTRGDDT